MSRIRFKNKIDVTVMRGGSASGLPVDIPVGYLSQSGGAALRRTLL